MGGTTEEIENASQYRVLDKQFSVVNYYIYIQRPDCISLLDESKFRAQLSKNIEAKLDELGVSYTQQFVDGGGGGFDTLMEIIKFFWEHKNVLTLASSVFGYAKRAYSIYIENTVSNAKPNIDVHFYIEYDGLTDKLTNDDLSYLFSKKLSNLFVVVENVQQSLTKKYINFKFNLSLDARIFKEDINILFKLNRVMTSSLSKDRVLKIIKDLRLRQGLCSEYSMLPLGIIKRQDSKVVRTKDDYYTVNMEPFYMFFSSRIISDYKK